jgi:hypothetical protein
MKKLKRLTLRTETIRELAVGDLVHAIGGDAGPMTIRSFDFGCRASEWDVNCKPSGIDVCPM